MFVGTFFPPAGGASVFSADLLPTRCTSGIPSVLSFIYLFICLVSSVLRKGKRDLFFVAILAEQVKITKIEARYAISCNYPALSLLRARFNLTFNALVSVSHSAIKFSPFPFSNSLAADGHGTSSSAVRDTRFVQVFCW